MNTLGLYIIWNYMRDLFCEIGSGVLDSFKGIKILFYLDSEIKQKQLEHQQSNVSHTTKLQTDKKEQTTIAKRVLQCCVLNGGIFWFSIAFFEYLVLPGLHILTTQIMGYNYLESGVWLWAWLKPCLIVLFALIWIVPLFVMSKIINSLWFQDIADYAYKFRKGRPQYIPTISKLIADILMNLLIEALFLGQSMLVDLIPLGNLGHHLSFVHIALLYSLYSFEYKWFNMGWELHSRLTFIEYNWPYFFGFGLPLTLLTDISQSFLIRGCVFSIIFPLLILSSTDASPKISTCDFRLRLFAPVICISNALFSRGATPARQSVNPPTPVATSHRYSDPSNAIFAESSTPRSTPSPTTMRNLNSHSGRSRK